MFDLLQRSIAVAVLSSGILGAATGSAQEAKSNVKSAGTAAAAPKADDVRKPLAAAGEQVVIKRDAVRPIDPQRFRFPLYLVPMRTITIVAPTDGVVRTVSVKAGDALQAQADVVRLDNTVQKFQLQRAQSLYKAAMLEQKLSPKEASADQAELTQARVDAAKADFDLATYHLDQTTLRAPFTGEILRTMITEGQFVRAGDPVAILGETSKLQVEIPIPRSAVDGVKTLSLKVEDQEVEAAVHAVQPLDPKFDTLRELFDSLTSVVLVIDSKGRMFRPGQTVFTPVIPRHPVVEVATSSIGNRTDGGRKVQVLRDYVVRDIAVELMGSIGPDRVFVNGPFADGDEVIIESSHQLADGFPVRNTGGKTARGDGGSDTKPATKPAAPATDF